MKRLKRIKDLVVLGVIYVALKCLSRKALQDFFEAAMESVGVRFMREDDLLQMIHASDQDQLVEDIIDFKESKDEKQYH